MKQILPVLAATLLLFPACQRAPKRAQWNQWRGPDGLGVAVDNRLPVTWSADSPNVRWKTPIPGLGNSSPIASDGRVFLTAAVPNSKDGSDASEFQRAVVSFDLESGKILWQTPVFVQPKERIHWLNSMAAPTPAADGQGVYAYFGSILARLDLDGEIVWKKEVEPSYAEFTRYGVASSPVLTDDAVIVAQDQESGDTEDVGWLAAFDKQSGAQIWRAEWDNTCCTYSTPLVVRRGGKEEVLFALSGRVVAFSAETGEQLWRHGYKINQLVSSPVIQDDLLGISGGAHNVKHTLFLRLVGTGANTQTQLLWESGTLVPQTSSPVLYNGLFFTVTDQGVMACYEAETGKLLWKARLPRSKYRASLVAGDGKIFAVSSTGWTTVVAAAPEYQLLADNHLGEPGSNASPAVAEGCLLLRTKQHLVCLEETGNAAQSVS